MRLLVEEMPRPGWMERELRALYDFANRQHWALYQALREGRTDDAVEVITQHVRENWTYPAHEPE